MLIIVSRDPRLHVWCADPSSHADDWGLIVNLGNGNQASATALLISALGRLGDDEPLCLVGHGNDTEIGDEGSGPSDWTWTVRQVAAILAARLGLRGYHGKILAETCAETVTNFTTHLALALAGHHALRGVWLYGYNRPVDVWHTFPAPSQLDSSVELQPVQVT